MRSRRGLRVALALGTAVATLIAASGADAATDAPGTQNLQLSAGQLSVDPLTLGTLQGVVGGTASGQLLSTSFSDTTTQAVDYSGNGNTGAYAGTCTQGAPGRRYPARRQAPPASPTAGSHSPTTHRSTLPRPWKRGSRPPATG